MHRFVLGLLIGALLAPATLIILAPAVSVAQAQSEPGWVVANAITFQLYTDAKDVAFGCTGFYWRPRIEQWPGDHGEGPVIVDGAWYLSAGHCASARYIRVYERVWYIFWPVIAVRWAGADFMVARGPDYRKAKGPFPDEFAGDPIPGDVHLTIGFAAYFERGDEDRTRGTKRIQALMFLREDAEYGYVYRSSSWPIPGNSGSPVLTKRGELVGILWGYSRLDFSIVYVTPIRAVHKYAPWAGH